MTTDEFERLLSVSAARLDAEVKEGTAIRDPRLFERRVREVLRDSPLGAFDIDLAPHPHIFPDIVIGQFGIEVKVNSSDSWRSVGNSVFEGTRSRAVQQVYVLFGKMGGRVPGVKWRRYAEAIVHVRTSHVPRFEVDVTADGSLFEVLKISYDEFSRLPDDRKMTFVRNYAKKRLRAGEHLWWLGDSSESQHTLGLNLVIYTSLDSATKRRLRAEAALLCPEIVRPSRAKGKYDSAVSYLMTYRGVLCHQARDLFSAGSVAMRSDRRRGGVYLQRALYDIEPEMRSAAAELEPQLFVEYWGEDVAPVDRIGAWLKRADGLAKGWIPSESLFRR